MKETELAKKVIAWLNGWEVYQEVQINESVVDIVAVCGNLTWIIETKTSANMTVLEQALNRKRFSNYVSIAIPTPRRYVQGRAAFKLFCRQNGIGLIQVSTYEWGDSRCYITIEPVLIRKHRFKLRDMLLEKQKTYAEAGNANGKRWTPFKQTCDNLRRLIKKNPGICLKDAIDNLEHHYSSKGTAKACISQYLQSGSLIEGVIIKKEGRYLRLYPEMDRCVV